MIHQRYGQSFVWQGTYVIIYRTYEYYIYKYPQKRFHGKTAYQVRQEALAANTPEQYPIAPNRKIERFWEKIEKNKAKQ